MDVSYCCDINTHTVQLMYGVIIVLKLLEHKEVRHMLPNGDTSHKYGLRFIL